VRSLFLAVLVLASPGTLLAQEPAPEALELPLRGFTPEELELVEPLLEHGIAGLVELPHGRTLPGIHLAAIVEAPADAIADLVSRPADYPRYMPAVSEVVERDRHEQSVAFTWHWRTSIFSLGGDAMLTRFSPRPSERARGHRIVVERTGGDLGMGREVWRIVPRGPNRSLVLLSTRMDLRDANYITRQMGNAAMSLSRSINLSMAFAVLSRTRLEAERARGFARPEVEATLHRPAIDLDRIEPLLHRGDVLLVETNGLAPIQTSVATRVPHAEDRVRQIMLDPVAFTQALISGSQASVRQREGTSTEFDWSVDLPLVGTSGTMSLAEQADRTIHLDATGGAMRGGRWRFETRPARGHATTVLGWASFEVADANFLLRAIADADAGFRPGLSAATEVMMARALRIRLMRP
jgi:hypothetical protein